MDNEKDISKGVVATLDSAQSDVEEFNDLISKISYVRPEVRKLWQETYRNAVEDRVNASLLFLDLYKFVANSREGHLNYGDKITRYLEKMSKANEQLLKISEMANAAKPEDEEIDADDLYETIANENDIT